MGYRLTAALCAALMASGCASTGGSGIAMPSVPGFSSTSQAQSAPRWFPTIDTRGVDQAKFQKDYAECKAYADADPGTNSSAAAKKKALKWGLGGAALVGAATIVTGGAALAVALPAMAGQAAMTGGMAAASGGFAAKAEADAKYRSIITSCLQGRAYSVLN